MQTGTVLNKRYRIVDLLAEGGMARVYRAQDLLLDRAVAVKVLREQYASDRAFLERFHQEARAAAGLAHPNIVAIYDVGAENGVNYIVMELVDGPNLKQIIQQEAPCVASRTIDIALQVLSALSYAHERGLVHRDVKPQNILVTGGGHVKVADFGIARAAAASQLTETGVVLGSVHYCAPEQAMGKGATQASDVYSVGVVLYEMLSGHLPFDSDNALGIALKHVQEPPPPLRQFNPHLSPGLESIVLKALAKEPGQRFASADEMLQALQAYRRLGEQATSTFVAVSPRQSRPVAAPVGFPNAAASASAGGRADIPAKRRTFDWLVVFFGLLILAMIVGWIPLASRLYDLYFRPVPVPTPPAAVAYDPTPTPTMVPSPTPMPTATPQLVLVPNLVGLPFDDAQQELESSGLTVTSTKEYDGRFPVDVVVSQTVPVSSSVSPGSNVGLIVSRGPEGVLVPNVRNLLATEAVQKLQSLGLKAQLRDQWSDLVEQGRVVSQSPPAESTVSAGSSVALAISRGPQAVSVPTPLPSAPPGQVVVPYLIGLPEGAARQVIDAARLSNTYVNYQSINDIAPDNRAYFNSIPVGSVVSQDPRAGTVVDPGTAVRLAVRKE